MDKETHIYLAQKIYESVVLSLPLELSLDAFCTANTKPDRIRQSIVHPHFADWSFKYIEKQASLLSQERLAMGKKVQTDFLVCLGRITHYLCDYFCHVHMDRRRTSIREHIEYEMHMKYVVKEHRKHYDSICRTFPTLTDYRPIQLRQLYSQCLDYYQQQPVGFERDMKAATWISVQVAGGILSQCLINGVMPPLELGMAYNF